ncbi:DUF3035 domain-containing protein [Falsirhodobacter algicola]|uniref:DUF3035 domain-containing protein n=1 Tax=Falsirhodobacter algicola TaxID=2692330 RepID=A0A8J8MSR0_9RHOB|nr:DUF3035 domain-containing protein [Falsirhodobacter algicola]QUS36002.1 DUF3035 domain-containing protein [Falsirhodobacter algicola]
MRAALALAGAVILTVSACGGGDPDLVRLRTTGDGPDPFSVVPQGPLEMPPSLDTLPVPTPGGVNRTEPDPRAQAITALGGTPGAGAAGDNALLTATARYGRQADIRSALDTEDEDFRQENRGRLLNRIVNGSTYYDVYSDEILDPADEAARWREQGLRTPSAPPSE